MRSINKLIMTLAGLLLIVAAGLKFYEMVDSCVPSWDVKAQAAVTAAKQTGEQLPAWKANVLGFWESYEFNLIQIPLEFALGVWLICGLFRKAAWIAGSLAFFFFIFVTIGKWITGAADCGCWGTIKVDPRITLFAADIPLFLLLAIFRPKGYKLLPPPWPNLVYWFIVFVPTIGLMVLAPAAMVTLRPDCITVEGQPDPTGPLKLEVFKLKQELSKNQQEIADLQKAITELKQAPRSTDKKAFIGVLEVIATEKPNFYEIHIGDTQTLYLNTENLEKIYLSVQDTGSQKFAITQDGRVEIEWIAPDVTEVVDPTPDATETNDTPPDTAPAAEQWDWLQYVVEADVREQLSHGLVVVMMHRYDCPVCEEMAPQYSEYYKQLVDQGADEFKIAFLAIPPYGEEDHVPDDTLCIQGKLTDEQDWQLMSPYVIALLDGQLVKQWKQGTAPEPESLLEEIFGQ